jgi:O-acetyl-ADP-ribose deacetylase (regulator of RNase III)
VIRVIEQALGDLPVDAVVRAADEHLEPVGPASEALDRQGGEELRALRRVQAPLDVGSAVITGAGDLAAEFVLHIVIQGEGRAPSRDTVRRALTSAWHRAEGWQLGTVGATLRGLGGASLTPEEAAVALVETFRDRPSTTGFPAELHIVIASPDERGAVEPFLGPSR